MAETEPAVVETRAETTPETTWRDGLSAEIKDHPSFKDLADVNALATKLIHAEKLVGADKLVIPGRDATDDETSTFFNALGRPEEVGGYEIPTENMPEGFVPDSFPKDALDEFHRIGLTKQQTAAVIRLDANRTHTSGEEMKTAMADAKKEAVATLQKEWGNAFEQNMSLAHKAIDEFSGDGELRKMLNESGWGDDPRMVRAFAKVGRALSEDEVIGGGGTQGFIKSPDQAKAEMAAKKQDSEFMKRLTNAHVNGHPEAKAEWEALQAAAFATPETATPLI